MGVVNNISANEYPKQGGFLGRRCTVMFQYGVGGEFLGTIVRDDIGAPHLTVIKLDDGRVVLSTECQYGRLAESDATFVPWVAK